MISFKKFFCSLMAACSFMSSAYSMPYDTSAVNCCACASATCTSPWPDKMEVSDLQIILGPPEPGGAKLWNYTAAYGTGWVKWVYVGNFPVYPCCPKKNVPPPATLTWTWTLYELNSKTGWNDIGSYVGSTLIAEENTYIDCDDDFDYFPLVNLQPNQYKITLDVYVGVLGSGAQHIMGIANYFQIYPK